MISNAARWRSHPAASAALIKSSRAGLKASRHSLSYSVVLFSWVGAAILVTVMMDPGESGGCTTVTPWQWDTPGQERVDLFENTS
jgi:hypothetical protein